MFLARYLFLLILFGGGLPWGDAPFASETAEQSALRIWQGMHIAILRVERSDGNVVRLNVRVADDPIERAQGMQFLSATTIRSTPIWFVFPAPTAIGWHMQNVRLALDIAWVDTDGRVVDVQRMTPDQTAYTSGPRVPHAIEMAAGEASRLGIQPGARSSLIKE